MSQAPTSNIGVCSSRPFRASSRMGKTLCKLRKTRSTFCARVINTRWPVGLLFRRRRLGRSWLILGLLAYHVSKAILNVTNSQRLATGFLRAAAASYRHAQMYGVCEMLREKWPAVCPLAPAHGLLPSQALGIKDGAPPPLRRASISTSAETVASQHSSGGSALDKDKIAEKKAPHDQLDALA